VTNIIQFPVKQVRRGTVRCAPLGIHFPALVRQLVTTTADHLAPLEGVLGEIPEPGIWVTYDLGEPSAVIGETALEEVTYIRPGDQADSIVIRHHRSFEHALGYLEASGDFHLFKDEDEDVDGSGLYQSDEGIFTMATVPTRTTWPGPLVFHVAVVPTNNVFGEDSWAHIVGPTGEILAASDFGF
jgi:hypothetical protein